MGLQQTGLQGGGHQGFQVASAQSGVGVLGVDHFALLGQADLPTYRARGLRKNSVVAGATATTHGTTSAMEQTQSDAVLFFQLFEHIHQGQFGLVERPVAGENAAVFVAVRVTQHDVLLAAAAFHHGRDARQGVVAAHDVGRLLQVFDGFKQGRHNQLGLSPAVQTALQQAGFFLQHQHFQQITHALGVADDGVANRLRAKVVPDLPRSFKNPQFRHAVGAVSMVRDAQGAGVVQHLHQQGLPCCFIQLGVVGFQARHFEQLGHHQFVLVRALPQIDCRQMETKHLHRTHQRTQSRHRQSLGVLHGQGFVQGAQIGQQAVGIGVGVLRRQGVPRGFFAREVRQGGGQTRIHKGEAASIGLVLPVGVGVGRRIGQGLQGGRHTHQHGRTRQFAAQPMDFSQVVAQRHLALALQGVLQSVGVDIGVAIAVAAHPLAHAQKRRNRLTTQIGFQVGI